MNDFVFPALRKFAGGLLLAVAPFVQAHSVWIEATEQHALLIRFGEPGDKFEESPGHLDSLSPPLAWSPEADGKPKAYVVEKKRDHFLLVGARPDGVALGETRFPVMKRGDRPGSWPQFYVRWQPAGALRPAAPALTLDIVPAEKPDEFRVYLRGKPLAGAKVIVEHLGGGVGGDLVADDRGLIRYATATPGTVLMTCNHKEPLPGFSAGAAYEVTSHNTALTWRQP